MSRYHYYEHRPNQYDNYFEEDSDEIVYLGSISQAAPLEYNNGRDSRTRINSEGTRAHPYYGNNSTSSMILENDVETLLMRNPKRATSLLSRPQYSSYSSLGNEMERTNNTRHQQHGQLIVIPSDDSCSTRSSLSNLGTTSNIFCDSYIDLTGTNSILSSTSTQLALKNKEHREVVEINKKLHDDKSTNDTTFHNNTNNHDKKAKQPFFTKRLDDWSKKNNWKTKRQIIQNENFFPKVSDGHSNATKSNKLKLLDDEWREEDERGQREDLCVICQDDTKDCVLLPCRHLCACKTCASSDLISTCPICREEVDAVLKVYM